MIATEQSVVTRDDLGFLLAKGPPLDALESLPPLTQPVLEALFLGFGHQEIKETANGGEATDLPDGNPKFIHPFRPLPDLGERS